MYSFINKFPLDIYCYDNFLTSLDLHQNLNLQYLHCYRNLLTNLNIGSNLYIKVISTSFNDLVDLDISQCPNLEFLFCNNNNLVNLNTQNNNNSFLIIRATTAMMAPIVRLPVSPIKT